MSSTSRRHNSCDLLSSRVNSSQLPPRIHATDVNETQDLRVLSNSGVPHSLSNTPTTRQLKVIRGRGARQGFLEVAEEKESQASSPSCNDACGHSFPFKCDTVFFPTPPALFSGSNGREAQTHWATHSCPSGRSSSVHRKLH